MDYIKAREALERLTKRMGDDAHGAGQLICDRLQQGLLPMRADTLIHGDDRTSGEFNIAAISNDRTRMQWRWDTGDLQITNYHWQIGDYIELKAIGVELGRAAIEGIEAGLPEPNGVSFTSPTLSVDGLPNEMLPMLSTLTRQRGSAVWWSWAEANGWVRTRNIEEVSAQDAWRRYLIGQGKKPDGALLAALLGAGDDSALARDDLVAALMAETVAAEGTNSDGERVTIPSTAWSEMEISYYDTVHLCPIGQPAIVKFHQLWFRREDLQREFPPLELRDTAKLIDRSSSPEVVGEDRAAFAVAPLPARWIGKDPSNYKTYMDDAAKRVFERNAANMKQAVTTVLKSATDLLLIEGFDKTVDSVYKWTLQIYRKDGVAIPSIN